MGQANTMVRRLGAMMITKALGGVLWAFTYWSVGKASRPCQPAINLTMLNIMSYGSPSSSPGDIVEALLGRSNPY